MIADEETKKLVEENRLLKAKLEALSAAPPQAIRPEDQAEWLALKPIYISSQDLYLDEGEIFLWSGIPNDAMEPRNKIAERHMRAWLESLPQGRVAHEYIIEASMLLRPREGEPVASMAEVMRKAAELQAKHKGLPVPTHEVQMPHKVENIPVVGNDPKVAETKRKASKETLKILPPVQPKKPVKITGTDNENPVFGS